MQILSMVAFGFAVFGDLPDIWTLAGASLIVGSGIYLVQRERRLAREVADAAPLA
jgi:drug/metabolite transporter (DMT)-like permease